MRFAYADPPYPGQASFLYRHHPDFAGEVDHTQLIDSLMREFDGWALSTSASALHLILPLCPKPQMSAKNKGRYPRLLNGTGTRVCAWVKPTSPWRPVSVQFAWEPVLIYGGRPRDPRDSVRDWIRCAPSPQGAAVDIPGAKPQAFCFWLFRLLGLETGDELVDLYPGSGAVGRAWDAFSAQTQMEIA